MILTGRVDEPKKSGDSMTFPSYDEIVTQWVKYDLLDGLSSEFALPFDGVIAFVKNDEYTSKMVDLIPTQKDTIYATFFVADENSSIHLINIIAEPDSKHNYFSVNVDEISGDYGSNGEKGFSQYMYFHILN